MKNKKLLYISILLILAVSLVSGLVDARTISEIGKAAVKIEGVKIDSFSGEETIFSVGSGTIISKDGLILTNAHVAKPHAPGLMLEDPTLLTFPSPDRLLICINEDERAAPRKAYYAEVVAYDGVLDVALLKITHNIDGSKVNNEDLNLPHVDLGNSSLLSLGEEIFIFGYPPLGGETITFTSGRISGFTKTEKLGNGAWIKTEAKVSPGNSGGLAANETGKLVGIPTQVVGNDIATISRLRPVDLVKEIIDYYKQGKDYKTPYLVYGSGQERLLFKGWYNMDEERVTGYGNTNVIYGIFGCEGFTRGQDIFKVWKIDENIVSYSNFIWKGEDVIQVGLENGGEELPPGDYEVSLFTLNNERAGWNLISQEKVLVGEQEIYSKEPFSETNELKEKQSKIRVQGRVIDVYSKNEIVNATVIFFKKEVTPERFKREEISARDILIKVQTANDGSFKTPAVFDKDSSYIVAVMAKGYEVNAGYIEPGKNNNIEIPLTRGH